MSVIVVLIGFSIVVAVGFLIAFLWAVRSGQYDDDVSPSVRILFDNDEEENADKSIQNQPKV
ncbi:MAG: cbb3-type cytochrome oxidase assembly protein CcoS [Lentimicrobium sp.]|jgi:cbb3-type cytochrome oxidase maturation protein|nr:MAG: cytochrome oxidase maturation protein [Bacteroidota bacterium]MBW6492603.1 cbb3-type cytochrome oxidase assembly protein CcoS [Lentimicrobium sp.]